MCRRKLCLNRLLAILTLSLALLWAASLALLAGEKDLDLTITPTGINGSYSQGMATIYFDSHAEGTTLHTIVRTQPSGGTVLADLLLGPTSTRLLVAGVEVTRDGGITSAEWDLVDQLRASDNGAAIQTLVIALLGVITDDIRPYVSGFSAIYMLWRDKAPLPSDDPDSDICPMGIPGCLSPLTQCLGCCGPGCWGCTGCCTLECLAHDICVRLRGHRACLPLLLPAILSMARCFCRRPADSNTSALCLEVTGASQPR
jgi:hypothetical protein